MPLSMTRRSRNQSGERWASAHRSTQRGRRADAHRSPKVLRNWRRISRIWD